MHGVVSGKPTELAAKITAEKLQKHVFSRECLLHMLYPKEKMVRGTNGDFLKAALLKENIVLRRYCRLEVGQ